MELIDREQCTGCCACAAACPVSCMKFDFDDLGNGYPVIDAAGCIECGRCVRVCPEQGQLEFREIRQAYAVWSLDPERRKKSASGGAAAEFYREAIDQGYLVCGVGYSKEFHAVHVLTDDADQAEEFQQSKYVYSEMAGIYEEIKRALEDQKKVLFISLPCKAAGLKTWLRRDYENLLTVDIVCHGTPPYHLLREHIEAVADLPPGSRLSFREDNEFRFCLRDDSGRTIYSKIGRTDPYLAAFLEGLDYRESCYQCRYARPERISDLTICDFWGLGTELPFEHPYTGSVSAVLINSDKGKVFFEQCRDRFFAEERPVAEAVRGNDQLNKPSAKHPARKAFEEKYRGMGFEQAVKACLKEEIACEQKAVRKRTIRSGLRSAAGVFLSRYR